MKIVISEPQYPLSWDLELKKFVNRADPNTIKVAVTYHTVEVEVGDPWREHIDVVTNQTRAECAPKGGAFWAVLWDLYSPVGLAFASMDIGKPWVMELTIIREVS